VRRKLQVKFLVKFPSIILCSGTTIISGSAAIRYRENIAGDFATQSAVLGERYVIVSVLYDPRAALKRILR
jgi:hypothetical protein